ncbi:hypothetical protein, partial [Bradyrhizobium sp.]|uniref:hypothetical protein n=1 Tax=Bradyrhizobium sp. TaxID=376 RepID=UPI003BAE4A18
VDTKFVLKLKFFRTRKQKNILGNDEVVADYMVTSTQSGEKFAAPCLGETNGEVTSAPKGEAADPKGKTWWEKDEAIAAAKVTVGKNEILNCSWSYHDLQFNRKNNRFLLSYLVGYLDGANNNENTPSVSGGVCTKID